MRGDETSFYNALAQLAEAIKRFENGGKFHQYSAEVDKIFANAHWNKADFYEEVNKLRGIQMHTYQSEKKVVKKRSPRKKKEAATQARTVMFGDEDYDE